MAASPDHAYAQPKPGYGGAQNAGQQQHRYATPPIRHDIGFNQGNNGYQQQDYQNNATTGPYRGRRTHYTNDWRFQIFDCLNPGELCINTCICPCIVYGRTSARLRDPTLKSYDPVNHDCFVWCTTSICGLSWIFQMLKRRDVRNRFALKGDEVEDCLLSSCCACCALVQMEKEVSNRQSTGRPVEMNQPYVPQEAGMEMPPPA